ncbi:MAG: hypothetical protein NC417_05780 [Candidatus Gastranaerophilales bacterium]|nr:hypothetical protein [Candidatus Gastranaerophilales bacterium]
MRRNRTGGVCVMTLALSGLLCGCQADSSAKGYQDYTVQLEQYFVEYSDQYDYWDVITVEYPRLEGIDETLQEQLNDMLYRSAMDRVNYWHLEPDEEVLAFQEQNFSLFCSDVLCRVGYHSQYLFSVNFCELYAPGNPVWLTKHTDRGLTVNLLTGEAYELADIFDMDLEFARLWSQAFNEANPDGTYFPDDDESCQVVLSWFCGTDEELNVDYQCKPFYYLTEDKNFVIGLSLDPKPSAAISTTLQNDTYYISIDAQDLEAYRTDSDFWELYEESVPAGEVLECEDRQENLWLGEEASVWDYWSEH